ncbi:MAG: hypothetical protein WC081_03240 [Candidatus Ratteibacteria bacterium]|jgi:Tfp pilus assembly protein PilV
MNKKGFSLLETLLALFFVLIAIVGLAKSFNNTAYYNRITHNRYLASQLAVNKIEELRNMSYADMLSSTGTDAVSVAGVSFNRSWIVSGLIDDPADGLAPADGDPDDYRNITVVVTWTQEGRTPALSESLTTRRTKPLI